MSTELNNRTFTHQRAPLRADCIQWTGNNFKDVKAYCDKYGYELDLAAFNHLLIRGIEGRGPQGIPQYNWITKGENGEVKTYTSPRFNLLYTQEQ